MVIDAQQLWIAYQLKWLGRWAGNAVYTRLEKPFLSIEIPGRQTDVSYKLPSVTICIKAIYQFYV